MLQTLIIIFLLVELVVGITFLVINLKTKEEKWKNYSQKAYM